MKLTDLSPQWVGHGGPEVHDAQGNEIPRREGIALAFTCPDGCGSWLVLYLDPPMDGGPTFPGTTTWKRQGNTFETLTLSPSILRPKPHGCGWHGFIRNGEIVNA